MPIVRIALDVPLSILFDYFVSADMQLEVGQRVLVPFGRKQVLGVAMEWVQDSELAAERIKSVAQVLDDVPPLPQELLTLLQFCSDYYHHPLGMTVLSAMPSRLRSVEPITLKQSLDYTLSVAGKALDIATLPKRRVVQQRILQALQLAPMSGAQLRSLSPSAPAVLKILLEAGWVEVCTPVPRTTHIFNEAHALTIEQQLAVDAVTRQNGYGCFLLHGITGSGKTEIYVHLMHEMLQRGGQVLLLVPEINLTPQLENYFRSRFPDVELVSLHSGLADGERALHWLKAQSGEARIVLGTRLSVFTPLPKLSLILVDEEHDASFKQQDGLRYSARDVAIFRANQRGVPIVLGSATPSLESWYNAQSGRYRLLKLDTTRRATSDLADRTLSGYQPTAAARWPERAAAYCHRVTAATQGAKPDLHQPARLCAGADVYCLRLVVRVQALRGQAGAASNGSQHALPSLRLSAACAARLPDLRRCRSQAGRHRHAACGNGAAKSFSASAHPARG